MTTTSFEQTMRSALANTERSTFIQHVRDTPELTLGEIASMVKGDTSLGNLFNSVTIGEILHPESKVAAIAGEAVSRRRQNARDNSASREPKPAKSTVDVRSPTGRAAYDAGVVAALKQLGAKNEKHGTSAPEISAIAGGKAEQVRSALNRLIGEGKVAFGGKARGTRYWLA